MGDEGVPLTVEADVTRASPASNAMSPKTHLLLAVLLGGVTAGFFAAFAAASYVLYCGFIPLAPESPGYVFPNDSLSRDAFRVFALLIGPASLCAIVYWLQAHVWIGPLVGAAIGAGMGFLFWLDRPTAVGEFHAIQCHAAWIGAGLTAALLHWQRPT